MVPTGSKHIKPERCAVVLLQGADQAKKATLNRVAFFCAGPSEQRATEHSDPQGQAQIKISLVEKQQDLFLIFII